MIESKKNTWLACPPDSDFSIYNIPFGVYKKNNISAVCTRLGDYIIDVKKLAELGYLQSIKLLPIENEVFKQSSLNRFFALGKAKVSEVRNRIIELLTDTNNELLFNDLHRQQTILNIEDVEILKPVEPSDYTDFYSSIEHASNVGKMFRDKDNPLLPNWRHIPVGYHGRASSIVGSGVEIHRPKGQILDSQTNLPIYSPSKKMDFELEMAFITCGETELGCPVSIENAHEHIIGMVLFDDLSARDIQQWEYVPLGPFLGKNFGSVISNWVVLTDALEPFRVNGPKQEPKPLPYLQLEGKNNYDINLEVYIKTEDGVESLVCLSNTKYLYWNIYQQLAHQTVNGCNLKNCGIYASGTISGSEENSFGSMLELSWNATREVKLKNSVRYYIEDRDEIIMKAYAINGDVRVGFGVCKVKIIPAK